MKKEMAGFEPKVRASAVNNLLSEDKIELLKKGNQLMYREKRVQIGVDDGGCIDDEEKMVYSIVADAGSLGIWIRDIRKKSNIAINSLNKVLKNMESRKIIKIVENVKQSKRKMYMLFDLVPDESVTGGILYANHQFDDEFVQILYQQIQSFLEQKVRIKWLRHKYSSFTFLHPENWQQNCSNDTHGPAEAGLGHS